MTPSEIRATLGRDQELRKTLSSDGTYNSEALMDVIFWNIVVAFVVNVTASVVYDQLRNRLSREGSVSAKDIAELKEMMKQPIDGYDPSRVNRAAQAAAEVLEDHGVSNALHLVERAVKPANHPDDRRKSE